MIEDEFFARAEALGDGDVSFQMQIPEGFTWRDITTDKLIELADSLGVLYNELPAEDLSAFALSSIVFEMALRMIAAGHNDPGSVATCALRVLKRPGETMRDVLVDVA